jgi:hypothetical protein
VDEYPCCNGDLGKYSDCHSDTHGNQNLNANMDSEYDANVDADQWLSISLSKRQLARSALRTRCGLSGRYVHMGWTPPSLSRSPSLRQFRPAVR